MVRAAVAGVVDFTHADPHDTWWWQKLLWSLEELDRQQNATLLQARHQHYLALISHRGLSEEGRDVICQEAQQLLNEIRSNLFPWRPQPADASPQDQATEAKQLLEAAYGKMDSPEYQVMHDTVMAYFESLKKLPKGDAA